MNHVLDGFNYILNNFAVRDATGTFQFPVPQSSTALTATGVVIS